MATSKNEQSKKDSAASMDDVTRPGKTPVSATSRPVIVGHKSLLKKDPMVSGGEDSEESPTAKDTQKLAASPGERVIKPLDDALEKTEATEENTEIADEEKPSGASSAAVDALAGEVSAKREAEKASEEDVKKLAALEQIIESRQYFVPIGEVSKRRTNRIILGILILVLLAAAAANFAIDAELLDIGTQPLTDVL